jgi:hypothetical protein
MLDCRVEPGNDAEEGRTSEPEAVERGHEANAGAAVAQALQSCNIRMKA